LHPVIPPNQYADLLKPNVVDRDGVFVPSGWDSWGKIRVLRDGFDVEGVCTGWSVDLANVLEHKESSGGALEVYEDTVSDPKRSIDSTPYTSRDASVNVVPEQQFLQQQLSILEARVAKEPETPQRVLGTPRRTHTASIGGVERMVGVTSVNLGGIEVDVEDVADRLRRLKEREPSVASTPGPDLSYSSEIDSPAPMSPLALRPARTPRTPRTETDGDDKLKNFFQSLLSNKGK